MKISTFLILLLLPLYLFGAGKTITPPLKINWDHSVETVIHKLCDLETVESLSLTIEEDDINYVPKKEFCNKYNRTFNDIIRKVHNLSYLESTEGDTFVKVDRKAHGNFFNNNFIEHAIMIDDKIVVPYIGYLYLVAKSVTVFGVDFRIEILLDSNNDITSGIFMEKNLNLNEFIYKNKKHYTNLYIQKITLKAHKFSSDYNSNKHKEIVGIYTKKYPNEFMHFMSNSSSSKFSSDNGTKLNVVKPNKKIIYEIYTSKFYKKYDGAYKKLKAN